MIKLKKLLKLNFYNAIKFNIFKLFKKKYGLFKIKLGKIILDIENEGISKTLAYYSVREEDKLFIAALGKYLSPVLLEGLPDFVLHFCLPQFFKLC